MQPLRQPSASATMFPFAQMCVTCVRCVVCAVSSLWHTVFTGKNTCRIDVLYRPRCRSGRLPVQRDPTRDCPGLSTGCKKKVWSL